MTDMYRVRTVISLPASAGQGLATHWFKASGGTAQQAVTAVGNFWFAALANASSECTTLTEGEVGIVNSTSGQLVGLTSATPVASGGGGTGDPLPAQTQGLLRLFTGAFSGGRQVRGRLFIPGQVESVNNGFPSSGVTENWRAAGAALIADTNTLWGVYSRAHGDIFDITSVSSSTSWAVLRSRRS